MVLPGKRGNVRLIPGAHMVEVLCQEDHQEAVSNVEALGSLHYKLGLGLSSNPTLTQQDGKGRWSSFDSSAGQVFIGKWGQVSDGVRTGVSSLASV